MYISSLQRRSPDFLNVINIHAATVHNACRPWIIREYAKLLVSLSCKGFVPVQRHFGLVGTLLQHRFVCGVPTSACILVKVFAADIF